MLKGQAPKVFIQLLHSGQNPSTSPRRQHDMCRDLGALKKILEPERTPKWLGSSRFDGSRCFSLEFYQKDRYLKAIWIHLRRNHRSGLVHQKHKTSTSNHPSQSFFSSKCEKNRYAVDSTAFNGALAMSAASKPRGNRASKRSPSPEVSPAFVVPSPAGGLHSVTNCAFEKCTDCLTVTLSILMSIWYFRNSTIRQLPPGYLT